jgi:hypothetical protein
VLRVGLERIGHSHFFLRSFLVYRNIVSSLHLPHICESMLKMKELGWDKKPGVNIVSGRWQDTLEQLGHYDGIFFDTYSEFYEDLR